MDGEGFSEVTGEQSYCERMQSAFCGVCVGLLLFFGSWGVLFWNEGRAVKRQKDLDEGRGIVQLVGLTTANGTVDTTFNDKLVWTTGLVDGGNAQIYDDLLKLNVTNLTKAISYSRSVEMYQWEERKSTRTEKTSGGGTREITTYTYSTDWNSRLISHTTFREQKAGRTNPTSFLLTEFSYVASDIGLGAYNVDASVASYVSWSETWSDAPVNTSAVSFPNYTTSFNSGTLYVRKVANTDSVGDNRATLSITLPDVVSVIAKQSSSGQLQPYITEGDRELLLFSRGEKTSDELFLQAEEDNVMLTWILRFAGFLAMCIGVWLMLNPIATAFDVLPFCGDALEGCIGGCIIPCIAVCICLLLSLLIISIAWIFYRPYFAVGTLLMLGLLGVFYFKYMKPKLEKKPGQQQPQQQQQQGYEEDKRETIPAQPYGGEAAPQNDVPFGQALDNPPPSGGGGYSAP
mmetsp:Transcript_5078/g.12109  ORF Transcript_5078/g.12109 Transcript_5078/m.12109 type:complete len:460 (-) Transcript_5078:165-1544(-)|eukprot:CAMPEP_0113620984 /NCGR_PEP_ID=MMETSP0017_2-20120614/10708_1 /TAXON_ID=2856 /ORGANISM="Cylindrotheca closterium" /LENGTH=459 /DNA_ID=CAMNT_0000530689 /DNA_START=28 /DNA_END=1407 /DNA_ORIENTATION=- /assembly_acc=CAM_ASM_000147